MPVANVLNGARQASHVAADGAGHELRHLVARRELSGVSAICWAAHGAADHPVSTSVVAAWTCTVS
jgi:hypothetical protein